MDRRDACLALAALSTLAAMPARSQSGRSARIAWTSVDRASPESPFLASFRAAMRELGWVEGRNVVIDAWWGGGSVDGLKKRVPEILASRPDVIVSAGGPATRAMIDTNVQLPVVFTSSADAVIAKYVDSWAKPGGSRTGISFFALELIPKRLELIKEAMPSMKRIAIVGWPPHAGELLELEAARTAAEKLGLQHRYWGVNTAAELEEALNTLAQWNAEAILVFAGAIASTYPDRFARFAAQRRTPAFSSWADFAEKGNVMTYGPVLQECYARLASYVSRILKGAKPADLPVELPTKFELVVNLKAAKAIGVAIPQTLLLRANRVIE
jgi:putative tryptophan/tyrosine transport system substrate-binding protein